MVQRRATEVQRENAAGDPGSGSGRWQRKSGAGSVTAAVVRATEQVAHRQIQEAPFATMRNMLDSPVTTADQLLLHHEPGHRLELVRGELRRMSNAGWWHGAVAMRLGTLLQLHVAQHRLGLVFAAETGFLLARNPDTVRSPDAAFVRADRVPATSSRGYVPGAPDLAVEVRSPGDRAQLDAKIADWFAHGCQLVWLVDAEARTVTSLRPGRPARTFAIGEQVPGDDVVPGFNLPVAELFPPLG